MLFGNTLWPLEVIATYLIGCVLLVLAWYAGKQVMGLVGIAAGLAATKLWPKR